MLFAEADYNDGPPPRTLYTELVTWLDDHPVVSLAIGVAAAVLLPLLAWLLLARRRRRPDGPEADYREPA